MNTKEIKKHLKKYLQSQQFRNYEEARKVTNALWDFVTYLEKQGDGRER